MVQPPVLLLYGGRRTGKTSALRQLPKRLPSGLIPLYVDGQGLAMSTTLIGVAKNMADQMIESARLGRNIRLSFPDQRNLESDPFPTLQSWLREIERKLPGKRFLLCLDEFERLEEVIEKTDSKAPLNFLRHMLQHQRSWSVLFAGAHTLDEMALYWSDYLINTRSLRISYLREQEARELIVRPLENFPEIYKPDAVDSIIELTRCQPYLIQLLCYTLVEELNLRRDSVVTSNHVLECVPKALETGVQYFRELWNLSLGENDRQYLERLIKKHEVSGSDQMTQRYLINKEVLESSNGDIRFQIPLVKMYIESIIFSQGNCI